MSLKKKSEMTINSKRLLHADYSINVFEFSALLERNSSCKLDDIIGVV